MIYLFGKSRLSRLAEWVSITIVVSPLILFGLVSLNKVNKTVRDNIRIGDINQVAIALEMYYNDNKSYPGASGSNQWAALRSVLNDKYISLVPGGLKENIYEYWISSDGRNYVLNATLELSDELVLKNDWDGQVFGCDCDDGFGGKGGREYCLRR